MQDAPLKVFITGASSGIGAALAAVYARQGAVLGLVARSIPDARRQATYGTGGPVHHYSNSDIAVRLTSIKLAGFKSFVDPTHFQVPGQLVGVVGPNGCGKSNIIDAVRWVLGESRASELRGESMQDVIFNGSTARKPGSRASGSPRSRCRTSTG
ncbi:AAA family ATPase [Paraburkholderia sp. BR14261]